MGAVIRLPAPGSSAWMELQEARRQAALEASMVEASKRILKRAKKLTW